MSGNRGGGNQGHGGGNPRGRGAGRGGSGQGGGRGRGNGRGGADNRPTCQVCHKKGHVAADCWHRYDENYVPDEKLGGAATHAYGVDTNWYVDTGATDHITGQLDKLTTREKYKGTDQIHTASVEDDTEADASNSNAEINAEQPDGTHPGASTGVHTAETEVAEESPSRTDQWRAMQAPEQPATATEPAAATSSADLNQEFALKDLGDLHFFLGIEIGQAVLMTEDPLEDLLFL
ncbi:uncharacterized protein LOC127776994 [Oryza glaberrima]|uniref:uncharacterized protein LOC127776994 n=1 Tax=Oryza glaberrima TaxID=4538 RepID=UPI00224C3F51|nr:uncharacterized protein LOC127776994 [Oryza glaberrima]